MTTKTATAPRKAKSSEGLIESSPTKSADRALDILELLTRRGAHVSYTDPYVPHLTHAGHTLESIPFARAVENGCDCAVVATDHRAFDYASIARMPLVVDTRNALKGCARSSIFRL